MLGTFASGNGILAACAPKSRPSSGVLTADNLELIEDIGDTLLPTTAASPGAKAAGVGAAVNLILSDCYKPDVQQLVMKGLDDFRATCRARKHTEFRALSRADREQLLRELDRETRVAAAPHYFHQIRELVQGAYFSSQVGATQALRYVPVPGRFDGCVPLRAGQPAWS